MQVTSHYLNQWWLGYRRIYALLGLNELNVTRNYKLAQFYRTNSRFAPSQWEMALLCNNISHWLGASLESALAFGKAVVLGRKIKTWTSFNINTIFPGIGIAIIKIRHYILLLYTDICTWLPIFRFVNMYIAMDEHAQGLVGHNAIRFMSPKSIQIPSQSGSNLGNY